MRPLATAIATRHLIVNPLARLLAAVSIVSLLASGAAAQSATDGSTPPGLQPGSPVGSYPLSDLDTVNLFNGTLNFRLPLLKVNGRGGAGYPITLHVEKKWTVHKHLEPGVGAFYYADAGWWSEESDGWRLFNAGKVDIRSAWREQPTGFPVETLTRITFTAPDGTEYELRDKQSNGQPVAPQSGGYNRGRVFVTADGSSATFLSDWDIRDDATYGQGFYDDRPDGYLFLKDGMRFRVTDGKIDWMRDRNGNRVSFAYDFNRRVTQVTDSLDRVITITYPAGGVTYTEIGFKGFGGAQRSVKIGQTNLGSALRGDFTLQPIGVLFPELHGGGPVDSTVVNYVELPDGKRYQFQYNPYAELARVVLPTGGAIEYDYAAGLTNGAASGVFSVGTEKYIYRRLIERRTYPSGGSGLTYDSKKTYSRPETTTTNAGYVIAEQCTPSGSLGVCGTGAFRRRHSRHYFYGSARASFTQKPTQYPAYKDGREYKTEAFDTNATTLLKRIENAMAQRASVSWWTGDPELAPPNDVRTTESVTTLADANLVSKQTFSYDQYNNQTDTYDYDYGTGAAGGLLRRAHTDFLYTNPVNGADYACDPATTCSTANINANVIHLRTLTSQQWVSSDAAGSNKWSLTSYAYDQAGLTDRSGITGLCTTYPGGSCSSSNSTAYVTRGNATSVTRYTNAAAGTGALTTTSSYDIAGNVVSTTDAKGFTSQVSFADSFCNGSTCGGTYTPNTYAFASGTSTPAPDPTGQSGSSSSFVTSTVYDFWTGLVSTSTDINGHVTRAEYDPADELDRPKAIVRPGESRTDFEYSDAAGNLSLRTLGDIDGARRSEAKQFYDGMGRVYRKAQYENSDPSKPWVMVDTEYDALGNVKRKSLPYRAADGALLFQTTEWREMTYDALGRQLTTKSVPDNATTSNSYTGNSVTTTDQAGRDRENTTDALGRLTQVVEDPGGLNYLTSYTYDVLGNLRKVFQGGQQRFFMYDSLSRLVRAKNPEQAVNAGIGGTDQLTGHTQWSFAYAYDDNGNVTSQTDARGITTTYTFDNINRNTYVSYSDSTPHVKRVYDTATNGLGRLRGYWTLTAGGTYLTHTAVDSYDAAGRPLTQRQHFYTNNVAGPAFSTQRTYDEAGNLLTQTYPSGREVSYRYDLVGRLADYNGQPAFKGTLGDDVERTYASEVRYHEMGKMEQERYGTQTPVYNKHFFNSRGQLNEIRVSTYSISEPGQETNWNRGAILNVYSGAPSDGWTASGPDNNGNLRKQMVYVPNDDAITGWWDTTYYYYYDSLNRLDVSSEVRGGQNYWIQDCDYDRWGNRTINATNTFNAPELQFDVDTDTNRLGVPAGQVGLMGYDAAGNLINDSYSAYGSTNGTQTRFYDANGRMTSAQVGPSQTATYTYDGEGRRVKRNNGAEEVWQIYGMGGELLAEYAANASPTTPQKEYGYRSGELLVTAAPQSTNVAAASAGATATASTAYDAYGLTTARAINGSRTYAGSYWNDQTWGSFPDWLQIDFAGTKSISEIDLFFLQDNYATAEPTESTTFTQMGITAFDVQYWTGSAWANVPGGSVTGNNKVWRKLNFSPLTTSKIRVVVNAASDVWSRIVEVEAYETTGTDVRWMVSDQIGTPRMILDKTGSLASTKRHDYLPFGEELPWDAAGRTSARGYAADGVRQKFTGYERDAETGLDYARARYYGPAMGRFTSPDNFVNDTFTYDPASWNLYTYVKNNPLLYVDPTGETVRGDQLTEDQRQALIADWRAKTGYKKIYFDAKNGYKLTIDTSAGFDKEVNGRKTSATARTELLAAAESTTKTINIIAANGSMDIAFGRTTRLTQTTKNPDGSMVTSFNVRIDFDDFKNLKGDADVLESFSVGLVTMHEFEHALHSGEESGKDSPENGDGGPLESKYINPIRREMGLPVRTRYGGFSLQGDVTNDYDRAVPFKTSDGQDKMLRWQSKVVGGKENVQ